MDDLLWFTTSTRVYIAKLEDLLKALLKNGIKISLRNANYSKQNYSTWGILYV